ncbi:MAG: hypothetical protein H6732_02130 [Alphaproteobacteria bacterium]|nr:hypothetical protein [Alphaproteobacteria bacterium]
MSEVPPIVPSLRSPVVLWGLGGVLLLLGRAIARLTPMALEPLERGDLSGLHLAFGGIWVAGMVWSEGWRGFHQRFAPRAVRRAAYLHAAPLPVRLLAPLACMGLVWATPRRRRASALVLCFVIAAIVSVRWLPYPWRGLVDAGVVAGLGVGVASLLWHLVRGWSGTLPAIDPDLPDQALQASQPR